MTSLFHANVPVVEQVQLALDTYRVRLHCPELARVIRPGQFVMLRCPRSNDPLLGRPFALYDIVLDEVGAPSAVDIVYLVVGKLTRLLSQVKPGDELALWGPLGNGFPELPPLQHVGLVAGGIGQTPFLAYGRALLGRCGYGGQPARQVATRVSLFYGVRSANLLAGVEDFQAAGLDVHLASDDGTVGFRGYVTELLDQQADFPEHLFGCGPEPMMHALAQLAERRGTACHLSLETPMACGLGICFSCVTRVRTSDGWDYKRVCVDGPIFSAADLVWDEAP